jgi:hypothetical protein
VGIAIVLCRQEGLRGWQIGVSDNIPMDFRRSLLDCRERDGFQT